MKAIILGLSCAIFFASVAVAQTPNLAGAPANGKGHGQNYLVPGNQHALENIPLPRGLIPPPAPGLMPSSVSNGSLPSASGAYAASPQAHGPNDVNATVPGMTVGTDAVQASQTMSDVPVISESTGYDMHPVSAPIHREYVLTAADMGAKRVKLPLGKAAIILLPHSVRELLISDPNIADAVLRTPKRIYLLGIGAGETSAFFFDENGDEVLTLEVVVDKDVSVLQDTLNRLLPRSQIRVETVGASTVLTGEVANAIDAESAETLATQYSGEDNIVNLTRVVGKQQVLLKARIVEVNRDVARQFGISVNAVLEATNSTSRFGLTNNFAASGAPLTGLVGSIIGNAGELTEVEAIINAFERNGMISTLAEPTIVTVSGEPAQILAGGEFPVPTGQDQNGRVSVAFKEFGVSLGVTPIVLDRGHIHLDIKTSVSDLSTNGAFTADGVSVPSVNVRRADTTVEIPSGASLMIGGLIRDTLRQSVEGLPGIRNLPIIGTLFRAKDHRVEETELVIIVSPFLVNPTDNKKLQDPRKGLEPASALFSGPKLNKVRPPQNISGCAVPPCGAIPIAPGFVNTPPSSYFGAPTARFGGGQPVYQNPYLGYPQNSFGPPSSHQPGPASHSYASPYPRNAIHHGSYAANHALPTRPSTIPRVARPYYAGGPVSAGVMSQARSASPASVGIGPNSRSPSSIPVGVVPRAVPTSPIVAHSVPMPARAQTQQTQMIPYGQPAYPSY